MTQSIRLGVTDNDEKGVNGGTEHECTFHFRVTDTKEDVINKAMLAWQIIHDNLVVSNDQVDYKFVVMYTYFETIKEQLCH